MGTPWRPGIFATLFVALSVPLTAAEPDPPVDSSGIHEPDDPGETVEKPVVLEVEPSEVEAPLAFAPEPGLLVDEVPTVTHRPRCRPGNCQRCPDYCRYGSFDVLFLQRNVGTDGSTIAEDTAGGQPVPLLTNESAQPATAAGVRLFYGVQGRNRVGWEIGYTGVYGMFGEDRADAPGSLQVPGGLGQAVQGWATANAVRPTYASSLNMFEANIFQHQHAVKGGRHSPFPWDRVHDPYCHSFNWLFGLRWAGLNETADLNVQTDPGEPFSAYSDRKSVV